MGAMSPRGALLVAAKRIEWAFLTKCEDPWPEVVSEQVKPMTSMVRVLGSQLGINISAMCCRATHLARVLSIQ